MLKCGVSVRKTQVRVQEDCSRAANHGTVHRSNDGDVEASELNEAADAFVKVAGE